MHLKIYLPHSFIKFLPRIIYFIKFPPRNTGDILVSSRYCTRYRSYENLKTNRHGGPTVLVLSGYWGMQTITTEDNYNVEYYKVP